MSASASHRRELDAKAKHLETELRSHVLDRGRLAIVQAPPGSGKTWLLLKTATAAVKAGMRIAVATQTNAQADDICHRLDRDYPAIPVVRYASNSYGYRDLGARVQWVTKTNDVPAGKSVVVATAAKWGLVDIHDTFDALFVDEAWQLSWADFMLLGNVSERFVLIGDPGQIPPVVSINAARWETSPRPPHRPAPAVILSARQYRAEEWSLPASRRLPTDAVDLVQPFYDFQFSAYALPDDRRVIPDGAKKNRATDRVIDLLRNGSVAALTLPTPEAGPPLERDEELARMTADLVSTLLGRNTKVLIDGETRSITPEDIGVAATHHVMNSAIELNLPGGLRGKVRVETPERWQGLEQPIMIAVHPLSGTVNPSAFDLETGRLCVMMSRHKAGAIVVGRDHIGTTLRNHITTADQPLGSPDVAGRGHANNLEFWTRLESSGRVVAA